MNSLHTPPFPALLTALLLSTAAGAALAQQRITPGLWEHTMALQGSSAQSADAMRQMREQMAALPPEQRKMMEQMMARQGVGLGPSANTVRVCISPEQASRGELPQDDGDCKHQIVERSGKTLRYKFSCSGADSSSGEGEYTLISDKAYSGKGVINTLVDGKPERMTISQSGKWIGAACGNIKPVK
ncbi:MAG: DUF3617 domain-containing protein [Rubrivivax sp.]